MGLSQQRSLFESLDEALQFRNQVIEAGAGTGKTTRIVTDVLRYLLADGRRDPSRLVLMTFTEKAAGEIAARVRSAMIAIRDRLEHGETTWPDASAPIITFTPSEIRARLESARIQCRRLDKLNSQTIHSFCQMLLRSWPLDAGVDPAFRLIEGFERDQLLSEAFDEWIAAELHAESDHLEQWSDALRYARTLDTLRAHLTSLLQRREIIEDRSFTLGSTDELIARTGQHFELLASIDTATLSKLKNSDSVATLVALARERRERPLSREQIDALASRIETIDSRLTLNDLPKEYRGSWDWLRQIDAELLTRHYAAIAYRELAIRFFAAVDATKARERVLDFDDLLESAARLVLNDRRIDEVRSRFDTFFVDEFQDTDRVQARVIDRLVRSSNGALAEGRITLVGDPKQSIYSFRRAEPEVFHDTVAQYSAEGAILDVLDTQYRSEPPLLSAINAMFGRLFSEGRRAGPLRQPAYMNLRAGKQGDPDDASPRIRFLGAEASAGESDARAEAEAVAEWIAVRRMREDRSNDGDLRRFAVLLRKKTNFPVWADVFARRGIDLEMPSVEDVFSQRGSVDLLSVLQAIADPSDRAAKFTAARSIFFAMPDDSIALAMLSREGGREWADLNASLDRWRQIAFDYGAGATIDAILADRDTRVALRLIHNGDRWLARLEHIRRLAAEYDSSEAAGLRAFVRRLTRMRDDGRQFEPPPPDEGRNAVRLMTVHAAKGLEFDTVILPELASQTQRGGCDAFTIEQSLIMTAPASLNRITHSADGVTLGELQKKRNDWERERLFYVAVTRARREVVFCSVVGSSEGTERKAPNKAEFWNPLDEIFGLNPKNIGSRFPESYEELVDSVSISGESIPVAFERVEPRRGAVTPQRFVMGFDPSRIRPAAEKAPVSPPPRLGPSEVAMRLAAFRRRSHGVAIHRALELWDAISPLRETATRVGRELALTGDDVERLRADLSRFESSRGVAMIRETTIVARELPIVITENGLPREMRLDLLARDAGNRLLVIDYKTGQWTEERAARDASQVSLYCTAVRSISGEECEGLLWYTGSDRLVRVVISDAAPAG